MYDSAKTYSALCRHIWRQGELLRLSVSARLLCLALVEVRSRYDDSLWFTCSITDLHMITGLSSTTVKSAIRELEEKGLIDHQSGTSKAEPSRYRINNNVVGRRPDKLPDKLPENEPEKLPEKLPEQLPENLPDAPINNKEDKSIKSKTEDKEKEADTTATFLTLSDNVPYPVEKLSSLISDNEWTARIKDCMLKEKKRDISDELIRTKYDDFIHYLLAKGKKTKTIDDMKSHFINWLNINLDRSHTAPEHPRYAHQRFDDCVLYDNSPDKFKNLKDYVDN